MKLRDREIERLRKLQRVVYDLGKRIAAGKMWILERVIPTYLIYADGRTEIIYPPEVVEALAKWDELYQQEVAHLMIAYEKGSLWL